MVRPLSAAQPKGNLPLGLFLSFFIMTSLVLFPLPGRAAQVNLAWDPSTDSAVQGYRIFYGTRSGDYDYSADVGNTTTCTVADLQDGVVYYFAAKAYSGAAESPYSNEVRFPETMSYNITATAGQGGSISPSGTVSVTEGGSQTFTVTSQPGYTITDLVVDGVSKGAADTYTFSNVTTAHTIEARFSAISYTLTVNRTGTGTGTVTTSPAGPSFPQGTIVTLDAAPASGSIFAGWSGACSGTSFTCALAMTSNLTVTASFAAASYSVTASAGKGGSISPTGTATVPAGGSQTYVITPYSGYAISDVKVDGLSVGRVASYTFTGVAANHTIQASFNRIGIGLTKK